MSSLYVPLNELFVEGRTSGQAGEAPYTVRLAIAEQPVKPSRKSLHRVSVELLREGRAVEEADVAVEFHPLHAPQQQQRIYALGELVLAPQHRDSERAHFDGAMALEGGDYQVDVTINHESHAGFVIHM